MTIEDDAKKFQQRWIKAIENQEALSSGKPTQDPWEGWFAYRELSDTDNLNWVLPTPETPEWPLPYLAKKLAREVYFYKLMRSQIVPSNRRFQRVLDALLAAQNKLTRSIATDSAIVPELDNILNRCAATIEKTRIEVERRKESYWDESLLAAHEERIHWPVEVDTENRVRSVPPEDLVEQERIFKDAKYPKKLVKRLDLNARFQVRVAVILRSYLHLDFGISLRTIGRLTLLTYVCGGIGYERDHELIVDGRKITVGSVYQRIGDVGLK